LLVRAEKELLLLPVLFVGSSRKKELLLPVRLLGRLWAAAPIGSVWR
jgi:hypothetical protein